MKFYWLSHFSGCGGSTLGAIASGFKPLLAIENNLHVADLYKQNIPSPIIWGNIQLVDKSQLIEYLPKKRDGILIMQSSPPCQDYSRANTNQNKTSVGAIALAGTFWQYEYLRPEYIIIENVSAFENSPTYKTFEKEILQLDYRVNKAVLNAADYSVPQSRSRFFAVFSKFGLPQINLKLLPKARLIGWYEAITDLIPTLEDTELTLVQSKSIQPLLYRPLLVERVGYYNQPKVRFDIEPCWTLRSHLADDGKGGTRSNIINIVLADGTVKKVNTQVLSQLMSFPDNYQWSDSFKLNCHAIGNAIAPRLMQVICDEIKKVNN